MSNYEFRFFYQPARNKEKYVGRYRLSDHEAFNYYLSGINRGLSVSLWFTPEIAPFPHANIILDMEIRYASGYENGTRYASFYVDSIDRLKFLTNEEYNQIGRIS